MVFELHVRVLNIISFNVEECLWAYVHVRGMSVKSVDNVYFINVNVISAISVCKYIFFKS